MNVMSNITNEPKFGKHTDIVFHKMCDIVGCDFDFINSSDNWYKKYTFTAKQYTDFKSWLIDYLCNSAEARVEFTNHSYKDIDEIKTTVMWFMLQCCFTQELEEDDTDTELPNKFI